MDLANVERLSLQDLEEILRAAKDWGIAVVVIGGYAVRAHTRPRRFTKDIDLALEKKSYGKLRGLLKSRGYSLREQPPRQSLWLSAKRRIGKDFIAIQAIKGQITDIGTGKVFKAGKSFFKDAKKMPAKAVLSPDLVVQAVVCSANDLLVMKLIPRRDKDLVDAATVLLDCWERLDAKKILEKASESGLVPHIRQRLAELVEQIKQNRFKKTWRRVPETSGWRGMTLSDEKTIKSRAEELYKRLTA